MEFKKLKQFPKYKIYSNGTIWSEHSNKYLKPTETEKGYLEVRLYDENQKPKKFLVHRLVGLLFLENPSNLEQINHKDENKKNNDISNLEWCNNNYNANYGERSIKIGQALSKKILCVELNKEFNSAKEAHDILNIDASSIRKVCNGKRKTAGGYHWKEV